VRTPFESERDNESLRSSIALSLYRFSDYKSGKESGAEFTEQRCVCDIVSAMCEWMRKERGDK
jgi:hypothetical protein